MRVKDLYSFPIEPELAHWPEKFHVPSDLLSKSPQLFANLQKTTILGTIEEGTLLIGPVHVGEQSLIKANSIIIGPVILGPDVMINHGVIVRAQTYIGGGCSIDCGSVITSSLILNGTAIDQMVSINSSIAGTECTLATRSTVGGKLRQLGYGTFVGCSVTTRVGAVVPAGSQVPSGTTFPDVTTFSWPIGLFM